jgi:hypothetical protein
MPFEDLSAKVSPAPRERFMTLIGRATRDSNPRQRRRRLQRPLHSLLRLMPRSSQHWTLARDRSDSCTYRRKVAPRTDRGRRHRRRLRLRSGKRHRGRDLRILHWDRLRRRHFGQLPEDARSSWRTRRCPLPRRHRPRCGHHLPQPPLSLTPRRRRSQPPRSFQPRRHRTHPRSCRRRVQQNRRCCPPSYARWSRCSRPRTRARSLHCARASFLFLPAEQKPCPRNASASLSFCAQRAVSVAQVAPARDEPIGRPVSRKQWQLGQSQRIRPTLRDVERLQSLCGGAPRQVVEGAHRHD